jgi:hypothetical protein
MDQGSRFNATEILEALRQHDRRTWEDLYNSQWEPLCAFIRGQLGEDLACVRSTRKMSHRKCSVVPTAASLASGGRLAWKPG